VDNYHGTMESARPGSAGTEPFTLSTGETVELPLRTDATMLAAVFPAPRDRVDAALPDGLRPVRATADGRAAVALLSVEYHEVDGGTIEPYDEFAVVLPAAHGPPRAASSVPYLSALLRATSGYVLAMPVTTEPARALGAEVWGFPKRVAAVDHEDLGSWRRTRVSVDERRVVELAVEWPPAAPAPAPIEGYSYTFDGERLRRVPNAVGPDADVGVWPFTDRVRVALGNHPRADPIRDLEAEFDGRALARLVIDGEARFYLGEPLVWD
jgi:hypothetical protein